MYSCYTSDKPDVINCIIGDYNMSTMTLIERLTWAIVELSNPVGKPDIAKVTEVLQDALVQALLTKEKEETLKKALIMQTKLMGDK